MKTVMWPPISPLPRVMGRLTWARRLILQRLTSRQLCQGGCHLIQKRGVAFCRGSLPPLLDDRARELTGGRQRYTSDKSKEAVQRGEEREGEERRGECGWGEIAGSVGRRGRFDAEE